MIIYFLDFVQLKWKILSQIFDTFSFISKYEVNLIRIINIENYLILSYINWFFLIHILESELTEISILEILLLWHSIWWKMDDAFQSW